jgi:hypothetical protein
MGPVQQKAREAGPQVQPDSLRLSLRNGFTTYFVISPVIGLFATVTRVMRSDITYVMRRHHREFDASIGASGPHDFVVRFRPRSSRALPRPSHPAPTFLTIAKRPSCENRTALNSR